MGLTVAQKLPAYLDGLLAAFRAGRTGRFVHLGWWDTPPGADALRAEGAFEAAQRRLDERLLALADLADGLRVADVGCGLGGTLSVLDQRYRDMSLIGLNLDHRQLRACAGLVASAGNRLAWIQAEACALPLASGSIDRLLCVEAMFHFPSRSTFFAEAARVLAPGGRLVCSDIVRARGAAAPDDASAHDLLAGFGPWPGLLEAVDHDQLAAAAGLRCVGRIDASRETLPSHAFTAPAGDAARDAVGRAAAALARLHRGGVLTYPLMAFGHDAG